MSAPNSVTPASDEILALFEYALLRSGSVRMTLTELWRLWNEADKAWEGTWAARPRLADALSRLAGTQTVVLPAPSGRLWDNSLPPLPARITVPANRTPAQSRLDPSTEPWTPVMDWAGDWIRSAAPSQSLRLAAAKINRWLLGSLGRPPAWVAREERSLHIFDDEKQLSRLAALFQPGRLQPGDLRFDPPLGELRLAKLHDRGAVLVVENKSTFDSAWRALKTVGLPGYAAVVFGAGDAASSTVRDLACLHDLLGVHATEFHYAGDVDAAGIEAASAFAHSARQAGLHAVMAVALWDAVGNASPTGEDLTVDPARRPDVVRLAAQLGLPPSVITRLKDGVRVPQERIDRVALADTTWWMPQQRG